MATRGARNSPYARAAYAAAAVCSTFAALAGAVAAAAASTNPVVSVSVRDFALVPNTLSVSKGTQVRFTNVGQSLHRIVSDDGSFDSHPLQPGHNATFTFTTIGVFHLHCEIHPSMTMTVDVVGSGASGTPAPSDSKTATQQLPTTLPHTGLSAGSIVLSVLGLGLILLGMLFLAVGRSGLSPIPAVAANSSRATTIARVMGWENRFDDLLPGRNRGGDGYNRR